MTDVAVSHAVSTPAGGVSRRRLIAGSVAAPVLAVAPARAEISCVDPGEAARGALQDPQGAKLVILGSGSGPSPRPDRHMASHVMLSNGAAYVLDCGLGVTDQLARTGIPFSAVRSIFITHHHPDHNIEYGAFLVIGWVNGLPLTLRAYGPPPLAQMTRDLLAAYRTTIDFWAEDFKRPPLMAVETHEVASVGPVMQDENVKVSSVVVNHPPVKPALGYRFDFADRSIAFSGDTTPLEAVAVMAKGADVLVHEAMLPGAIDDEVRRIIATRGVGNFDVMMAHMRADHSPVEDVGRIAAEAGVKTLVLSHLAGAHPSVPDEAWRAPAAKYFKGEILVAHDLMVV